MSRILRQTKHVRNAVGLLVAVLGFQAIVAPVSAHHSHAAYEDVKLVSVTGTISQVLWRNPHMYVTLDVPSENGTISKWTFELAGTAVTVAAGLSRDVLKVGNHVTVICNPSRDPAKTEGFFMALEIDGKLIASRAYLNVRAGAEEGK